MPKTKMIFSMNVAKQLTNAGCFPIKTLNNTKKKGYQIWLFEDNELLRQTLTNLTVTKNAQNPTKKVTT